MMKTPQSLRICRACLTRAAPDTAPAVVLLARDAHDLADTDDTCCDRGRIAKLPDGWRLAISSSHRAGGEQAHGPAAPRLEAASQLDAVAPAAAPPQPPAALFVTRERRSAVCPGTRGSWSAQTIAVVHTAAFPLFEFDDSGLPLAHRQRLVLTVIAIESEPRFNLSQPVASRSPSEPRRYRAHCRRRLTRSPKDDGGTT